MIVKSVKNGIKSKVIIKDKPNSYGRLKTVQDKTPQSSVVHVE